LVNVARPTRASWVTTGGDVRGWVGRRQRLAGPGLLVKGER
jgi:hypothetical protein